MATLVSLNSNALGAPGRREPRDPAHFPIERELRFRVSDKQGELVGSGTTIDFGSKHVVFRTDRALPTGKHLEMAISWPAQLDQKCALKLIASGRIVGTTSGAVSVSIERFEFRTVGAKGLAI